MYRDMSQHSPVASGLYNVHVYVVHISLLNLYRKKSMHMHIFMYLLSNLYVRFKIVFVSMLVLSFVL